MNTPAIPEFVIGQMRVQTMPELNFFHVANEPTPMANLDQDLDSMMVQLDAAQALTNRAGFGPIVVRYFPVPGTGSADAPFYSMEVGVPVPQGTQPAGAAQIKTLLSYRCAALLYWGSLEHIGPAYGALNNAIRAAGLEPTGEGREWHYYFAGDDSAHNVIGLQLGVRG